MNETTRRALLQLNQRFYARYAAGFSASRERPWRGWDRLLDDFGPALPEPLRILDLGCGNGRFASYLAERVPWKIDYLGIDSSEKLLEVARERLSVPQCRSRVSVALEEFDATSKQLGHRLGHRRFDLVTLFGLLHHVPSLASRVRLLARAASVLESGGLLVSSLWRFDAQPGFGRRVVGWQEYNRNTPEPIDLSQLERGDHLLTWAGGRDTPRYCHFVDELEISELVAATQMQCLSRFSADGPGGNHNLYLVLGDGGRLC